MFISVCIFCVCVCVCVQEGKEAKKDKDVEKAEGKCKSVLSICILSVWFFDGLWL